MQYWLLIIGAILANVVVLLLLECARVQCNKRAVLKPSVADPVSVITLVLAVPPWRVFEDSPLDYSLFARLRHILSRFLFQNHHEKHDG